MKHLPIVLGCLGLFTGIARAQHFSDVQPTRRQSLPVNTVVAVTDAGLWIPDRNSESPHLHIPAGEFPGAAGEAGTLSRPAIEWNRRTDSFLVSAGSQLFDVRVWKLSPATWSIVDITPDRSTIFDFWDIDLHPSTGEIFLLDQENNEVLRFAPPFAAGMLPNLIVPVPGTSRCLALDSDIHAPAFIVGETSQTTRVRFNGSTQLLNFFEGARGLDQDPQLGGNNGAYMVAETTNRVGKAIGSPNAYIDMNKKGFCTPLALAPTDIAWNMNKNRAYVFANDGINQTLSCPLEMPAVGPNHIVIFPVAQAPPNVIPQLYTFEGGSGIAGTRGDLTLVLGDFAYVSPFGDGCTAGAPSLLELELVSIPTFTTTELFFELKNGAANSNVLLVVGASQVNAPLAGGCDLLASADVLVSVGSTNSQGQLDFSWPLPLAPTPGLDIYVQVAVDQAGVYDLTQALHVHFGL